MTSQLGRASKMSQMREGMCRHLLHLKHRDQEYGERLGSRNIARAARAHSKKRSFVIVTQGKQRHQNFPVGLKHECGTLYAY